MSDFCIIPAETPPWVPTRMVAEWLKVTSPTLHKWARQGRLPPPLRLGHRKSLWNVEAIRQAIESMQNGLKHGERKEAKPVLVIEDVGAEEEPLQNE